MVIGVTNLGGEREVIIRIMLQNMGGMCNTSDQSIQHIIDTFKNDIINERIAIIGLEEVNSNCNIIPKKIIYI